MKIVYYTCNTGYNEGFVPNITAELPENIEAYYLHDGGIPLHKNRGWQYIDVRDYDDCPKTSLALRQRFAKTLPHKFFPDADWTIYTDQKYYLPRSFFNEMLSLINNEDGKTFFVPQHVENRTLLEEVQFSFKKGTFSYDLALSTLNFLKNNRMTPEDFISTMALLLVRKNCSLNNAANERWFSLLNQAYTVDIRDQIFLPYTGAPLSLLICQDPESNDYIEDLGGLWRYPAYHTGVRTRPQLEMHRLEELVNVYTSLFKS